MKKINSLFYVVLAIMTIVSITRANAQGNETTNGIYLTESDFTNNRISDEVQTDLSNYVVEKFDGKVIIVRNGKSKSYKPGQIYGYIANGKRYRGFGSTRTFFGNFRYYKVLEENGIVYYSKFSHPHKSGGYTWFYYSENPVSSIHRISNRNLKRDFPAQPDVVKNVREQEKALRSREVVRNHN